MFRQQFTKLDAFGVQDCGLTGDSCGQPLFSHKPSYWFKSEFPIRPCTGIAFRRLMHVYRASARRNQPRTVANQCF
jgi:hypothetical protein